MDESIKQKYEALKAKIEAEFKELVAKIEGIFGRNNDVTQHIQATADTVQLHIDDHAIDNAGSVAAEVGAEGDNQLTTEEKTARNAGQSAGDAFTQAGAMPPAAGQPASNTAVGASSIAAKIPAPSTQQPGTPPSNEAPKSTP